MLRPQQAELEKTVRKIESGSEIEDIFLFWSPGGGKSLAPVILSDLLINNKKQIWVVPRNSLKSQGEADYQNEYYPVDKIARVADNYGDPFRGCDACITTYQAIGANPEKWIQICRDYNVMLILDEFHHLSGHGDWINAINPMKELSFLSVFMTGTITRGDNTKLPFVPYNGFDIDFSDTDTRKWIIYSRDKALKDGSILPFKTRLVNGSGKYIDKNGFEKNFEKFGKSGDELRCAFQTEYADHLIDLTIDHWNKYREKKPFSKLLIVSPDIKTAKDYLSYIGKYNIKAGIATSEDSSECKDNIKRFKDSNWHSGALDCLVTVAVAYEGLSVPEITHMAIMTLIRSIPWLEQCTARAGRNYPGKTEGYIFAPEDQRMLKALKSITVGEILSADGEAPEKAPPKEDGENLGGVGDWNGGIEALSSTAHIDGVPLFSQYNNETVKKESQSELEHRLRKEINSVINKIVVGSSSGNRKVKERVFWLRVKQIVNSGRDESGKLIKKPLKEMTVPELKKIEEFSRNYK